jgi:hypothetical protein
MNSTNDLETPGTPGTPAEHELARRLSQLAETTTVSPDAWNRIAARTVASPSSSAGFTRRHVRSLLATAAAVAVLIGLVVALASGGDEDGLRTTNHGESTTTTTERDASPDRRSSSTTTESSTTLPGRGVPTSAADPGAGTTPSTETEAPAGPGGTESGESSRAAPTRAEPTMTLRSSEYTVEIVATPGFHMSFRRTDDVGNQPGGPDGYGSATESDWSSTSNPRCLMSGGGQYAFPDAGLHAFTYGLVGSDIARIEIVMPGGERVAARIGPAVESGYRAWLVERPPGNTQGIEGLDSAGNVVASIGATYASGDDFTYSTATC